VLQCVAVCCSVAQCVAVCCSVLACVAACCTFSNSGAVGSLTWGPGKCVCMCKVSAYAKVRVYV